MFNGERQVYFFKNYCKDDKKIKLEDGVTKILISTKGKEEENLDKDLKAFMYYINGILPDNDFVKTVDTRIGEIKQKEIERSFYMQYELRLLEEREVGKREGIALGKREGIALGKREGIALGKREGKQENLVENIKLLIENGILTADQAIKILQVPEKEQELYLRLVNDPAFYEEYFSEAKNDEEEEYEDKKDLEEE